MAKGIELVKVDWAKAMFGISEKFVNTPVNNCLNNFQTTSDKGATFRFFYTKEAHSEPSKKIFRLWVEITPKSNAEVKMYYKLSGRQDETLLWREIVANGIGNLFFDLKFCYKDFSLWEKQEQEEEIEQEQFEKMFPTTKTVKMRCQFIKYYTAEINVPMQYDEDGHYDEDATDDLAKEMMKNFANDNDCDDNEMEKYPLTNSEGDKITQLDYIESEFESEII